MFVLFYFEVLSAFLLKIFYSPNSNGLFSFQQSMQNDEKYMRKVEKQTHVE